MLNIWSIAQLARRCGKSLRDLMEVAESAESDYRPFPKTDAAKKKTRLIDNPTGRIRLVQGQLQTAIFGKLEFAENVCGGVTGKSILDFAAPHVEKPVVVSLDIADCFPSTRPTYVYKALRAAGCGKDVCGLLTRLLTYDDRVPQGAPTSLAVVNLVLAPMQAEITAFARCRAIDVTFYVDDIAFSGDGAENLIGDVVGVIAKHGYRARMRKTRVMRGGSPQKIVGLLVNRHVGKSSETIETIRARMVALGKSGERTERAINSMRGLVAHVKFVNPRQGGRLESLAFRLGLWSA